MGKDFSALLAMTADVTLNMEPSVLSDLEQNRPDCIVVDSLCSWGKLYAQRLHIPYLCSTTSFAFNQYTAKLMKHGFSELFYLILGLPRIQRKIKKLQRAGYQVSGFTSLIQNDNDTPTIVYTSKLFQPMAESFRDAGGARAAADAVEQILKYS